MRNFDITHHHYYWIVEGEIPVHVALDIHNRTDPSDVRCMGLAGGTHPLKHPYMFDFYTDDGIEVRKRSKTSHPSMKPWEWENVVFDDEVYKYNAFITLYHVNSDNGLTILMRILKEYGLQKNNFLKTPDDVKDRIKRAFITFDTKKEEDRQRREREIKEHQDIEEEYDKILYRE